MDLVYLQLLKGSSGFTAMGIIMIPAYFAKPRRNGTMIKKYNTLIHTATSPKIIISDLTKGKCKSNQKKIYQNTSQNLKWLGFFSAVFTVVSIVLAYFETEEVFSNSFTNSVKVDMIRAIAMVISIFHLGDVFFVHLLIEDRIFNTFSNNAKNLFQDWARFKYFLLDSIICMIHHPPGFTSTISFTQLGFYSKLSSSDILFPFHFLKLKFLILFIAQHSSASRLSSSILSLLFPEDLNLIFILKSILNNHTYSCFIILFWSSVSIFGATLRVFEKHLEEGSIWEYVWLSFTTESTVGYGEVYPKTHIGRAIAGVSSILGVFVFSYSVIAVRNLATLSDDEAKMAGLIRYNLKVHNKLAPKAAEIIQKYWKSFKSGKVASRFEAIGLCKKFTWTRKKYLSQLNLSIEEQLEESGQIMSKNCGSILNVFGNIDQVSGKGRKMITASVGNYKRLVYLIYKLGASSDFHMKKHHKSSYLSIPNVKVFAKKRKNAIKKLFIHRAKNSPSSSKSPSFSMISLD